MSSAFDIRASELAAYLCARLCHDLVSPVSAVGAALDVLEDPDAEDMHDDAKALVRESANQAWAKLEFSRLAFGAAGSAPGRMDTPELRRVVDAMFARAKSEIIWGESPDTLDKLGARVLLNLVLLAVEALPRGGIINVEVTPDGNSYTLKAEGRRARLTPAVAAGLEGRAPEDGFDARYIQAYYAALLTREAGGKSWGRAEGERVEIGATVDPAPGAKLAKAV